MNNNDKIIINPDVVFYHIEKCMGTSIELMLYDYFKNIYPKKDIFIPKMIGYNHFSLEHRYFFEKHNFKVILSHMSFNEKYITSLFSKTALSITCVRNPIGRIISHYYHFDYKNYNKNFYMLDDDEMKKYVSNSKTILWRLSGNTNNLRTAKENLDKINCILIMENFNYEKRKFENYLNNKFKSKNTLNIYYNNKNEYSKISDFDKQKDTEHLLKYKDLISDEIELYNYILNMKIENRFKL